MNRSWINLGKRTVNWVNLDQASEIINKDGTWRINLVSSFYDIKDVPENQEVINLIKYYLENRMIME